MTTGQLIKAARKKAGMTQEDLGKKLGVSGSFIAQYETDNRKPKQETLLKIAKALGVHLRDLSDNSWLEEFDQQHPDAVENAKRGLAVIQYLEEMGFTISSQVLKWHWENENDPPEERVQIADEILTVLSKDGHTATFTDAEFEELQAGAKEAIEGRFYKKVLEQQKK